MSWVVLCDINEDVDDDEVAFNDDGALLMTDDGAAVGRLDAVDECFLKTVEGKFWS